MGMTITNYLIFQGKITEVFTTNIIGPTVRIWALDQVRIRLTESEGFGASVTTTYILKVRLLRRRN